jgi:cell division protein FtsB
MQPVERRRISRSGGLPLLPASKDIVLRVMLWAMLVICAAMLFATLSEAWALSTAQEQVQTESTRNAALRQDVTNTQRALQQAQSPAMIEREARQWGYIRPGEVPVILVQP